MAKKLVISKPNNFYNIPIHLYSPSLPGTIILLFFQSTEHRYVSEKNVLLFLKVLSNHVHVVLPMDAEFQPWPCHQSMALQSAKMFTLNIMLIFHSSGLYEIMGSWCHNFVSSVHIFLFHWTVQHIPLRYKITQNARHKSIKDINTNCGNRDCRWMIMETRG